MTPDAAQPGIEPGFRNLVLDSQRCFRAALQAMSRPGAVVEVVLDAAPPPPLEAATAALALTLLDADTRVWLGDACRSEAVVAYLRFHCGCPIVDRCAEADFVICAGARACPELDALEPGTDQYPDRSATVIWQLPSLRGGDTLALEGPGIDGSTHIEPRGLPEDFAEKWSLNEALYPQGIDVFLSAATEIIALPRSVRLRH